MSAKPATAWPATNQLPITSRSPYPENDSDRAQRFAKQFGDELRYVACWKSWLYWDGIRWVRDTDGTVTRKAQEMCDIFWAEAAQIQNAKERERAGKLALKAGDAQQLKAMIELAAAAPGIAARRGLFDSNPWLLGVKNGAVDLRTGQFRPAQREDYVTKQAGTEYVEGANCPNWEAHLRVIFNNDDTLIDFFQRIVGYTLTGLTSEQKLFFLHGAGQNGKSTTTETLYALVGDYAQHAPAALFVADRHGREPQADIARLHGARFVVGSEIEEGAKLAESRVKDLTGQDTLTGRFLYGSPFDFSPTHKLFMFGNHKPDVAGTDLGIWRRMLLIPFIVQIEDSKIDRGLPNKLIAELAGILNWAVEGCLQWQKLGLKVPETVKLATAEYQDEEDELGEFIGEKCVMRRDYRVEKSDLRQAYLDWLSARGTKFSLSNKKFTKRVRSRKGIGEAKSGVEFWTGLALVGYRTRFTDGTERCLMSDGSWEVTYRNGKTETRYPDGRRRVPFPARPGAAARAA
jgi:putative DNA primase/helicase